MDEEQAACSATPLATRHSTLDTRHSTIDTRRVAVFCSVMQSVAVCCRHSTWCSVLQCEAV